MTKNTEKRKKDVVYTEEEFEPHYYKSKNVTRQNNHSWLKANIVGIIQIFVALVAIFMVGDVVVNEGKITQTVYAFFTNIFDADADGCLGCIIEITSESTQAFTSIPPSLTPFTPQPTVATLEPTPIETITLEPTPFETENSFQINNCPLTTQLVRDESYAIPNGAIVFGDVNVNGSLVYDNGNSLYDSPEGTIVVFETDGLVNTPFGASACSRTENLDEFYQLINNEFATGCEGGCESVRVVTANNNDSLSTSYALKVSSNEQNGLEYQCNSSSDVQITIIGGSYNPWGADDNSYWRTKLYIFQDDIIWNENREPRSQFSVGNMENIEGQNSSDAERAGRGSTEIVPCVEGQILTLMTVDTRGSYNNRNEGSVVVLIAE